jgi:hypothetical protein
MHVCDQRDHPGPRLYSLHGLLQFFDEGPMVVYGVDFPIIDEFSYGPGRISLVVI